MIKINAKYYMAKYKNIIWIVLFIMFLASFIYGYEVIGNISSNPDSNATGVYGALFGAFLGGVLSLGGSVWVHNRQLKSKAEIIRKKEIYEPFYNELLKNKNILFKLDKNEFEKYPQLIKIDDSPSKDFPSYDEWTKIYNSASLIEIPKVVLEKMEELTILIRDYNHKFSGAVESISYKWKGILNEVEIFFDDNEVVFSLRQALANEDINYFVECFNISDDIKGPDWKIKTRELLDNSIKSDALYSAIKTNYQLIEAKQDEVIIILRRIIETISQKYEK